MRERTHACWDVLRAKQKTRALTGLCPCLSCRAQIWAGTKQRELKASSMQLLHAYTPQAMLLLGLLVPIMEPVGFSAHLGARGGAAAAPLAAGSEAAGAAAAAAGPYGDGTLLGYR